MFEPIIPGTERWFEVMFGSEVAYDADHDAYLTASRGHRGAGKPTHYYVMYPDGTHSLGARGEQIVNRRRACGLGAHTVREAITKADTRLAAWLAEGNIWDSQRYEWVRRDNA